MDTESPQDGATPSPASAGCATEVAITLSPDQIDRIKKAWDHMSRGPLMLVHRKPRWKLMLSIPGLWVRHFVYSRKYATVFQSARIASLLVRAVWGVRM
jgi:hypothetical protein